MTSASDASMTAVFRMVDLAVFLKAKGRSSEVILEFKPEGWFWKKGLRLEFFLRDFSDRLCFRSPKWGPSSPTWAPCKPPCLHCFRVFFLSLSLLCVQSLLRWSITSRCNGRVFSLLLELQHKFGPQMVLATGLYALRGDDEISCELCDG